MQKTDLPNLRRLAKSGAIFFTKHSMEQMWSRGVKESDVKRILSSDTNQLIEIQSPSSAEGKKHRDERDLVYDPNYAPDAIVVFSLLFSPTAEIRVITVEMPNEDIWIKDVTKDPALTRK